MPPVTAGFMCSPLPAWELNTATNTASPQPAEITIQSELFPLVRDNTTLATTPLPKVTSRAVPMNSASTGLIKRSFRVPSRQTEKAEKLKSWQAEKLKRLGRSHASQVSRFQHFSFSAFHSHWRAHFNASAHRLRRCA